MSTHSFNCASFITKGGAKRMIFPCVGFAKRPFSASFTQIFQAVLLSGLSLITMAFKRPRPLTNVTSSVFSTISFWILSLKILPKRRAFCDNFSSSTTVRQIQGIHHRKQLCLESGYRDEYKLSVFRILLHNCNYRIHARENPCAQCQSESHQQ